MCIAHADQVDKYLPERAYSHYKMVKTAMNGDALMRNNYNINLRPILHEAIKAVMRQEAQRSMNADIMGVIDVAKRAYEGIAVESRDNGRKRKLEDLREAKDTMVKKMKDDGNVGVMKDILSLDNVDNNGENVEVAVAPVQVEPRREGRVPDAVAEYERVVAGLGGMMLNDGDDAE
jgi:hypothetical protein